MCIIMHYMHTYAIPPRPWIVKYGGSARPGATPEDPLLDEVAALHAAGERIVLVHGGGPEIDTALRERGIAGARFDGLRATDERSLAVIEMVLCATINKRIVRALQERGATAVGISGQDGGTLRAQRSTRFDGQLGSVGEQVLCDPRLLAALLEMPAIPVLAPLALDMADTRALNINADEAAAAVAAALPSGALFFVTDIERVRAIASDPRSGIDRFSVSAARAFLNSEQCRDGMRPKIRAAIDACEGGAEAAYICLARPGALRAARDRNDATIVTSVEPSLRDR